MKIHAAVVPPGGHGVLDRRLPAWRPCARRPPDAPVAGLVVTAVGAAGADAGAAADLRLVPGPQRGGHLDGAALRRA